MRNLEAEEAEADERITRKRTERRTSRVFILRRRAHGLYRICQKQLTRTNGELMKEGKTHLFMCERARGKIFGAREDTYVSLLFRGRIV